MYIALGVVAALCCCMWPCGIVGAVFGVLARWRAPQDARRAKKYSRIGLIVAIVGLVAGIVALAVGLALGLVLGLSSKSSVRPPPVLFVQPSTVQYLLSLSLYNCAHTVFSSLTLYCAVCRRARWAAARPQWPAPTTAYRTRACIREMRAAARRRSALALWTTRAFRALCSPFPIASSAAASPANRYIILL